MSISETAVPESRGMFWSGWVLSALPALMLIFSAVMKLGRPAPVLEEMTRLGYPERLTVPIGILELSCAILYLVPRTSVIGAILVTAYLGGATATHVRVGDVFIGPPLFGVLIWLGLFLRDRRLRALLPLRS